MSVLGAYIVPHPPLIIPEVGGGREKEIQKTIDSYDAVAREIAELKPDTIVVISPHTALYADYFHISPGKKAHGDMSSFGAPNVAMEVTYDHDLAMTISGESTAMGIPSGTQGEQDPDLDHATFIPLYFVNKYYSDYKTVRCGFSGMGPKEHLLFGRAIKYAAEDLDRNIVIIASGDLSHKLKEDGPYGYACEGPVFDEYIVNAINDNDLLAFLTAPNDICSKAAECGLHSFQVMTGTLEGYRTESKLYSHQGNFGVGYAVGSFIPVSEDPSCTLEDKLGKIIEKNMDDIRSGESPIVAFARNYAEEYIRNGDKTDIVSLAEKCGLEDRFYSETAGTFVSIKKNGELRGCIGTIQATQNSIVKEVAENAVSACSRDPRFMAVKEDELGELTYSVDILGQAEPADDVSRLDPDRYGVIVTQGGKRGLLLPDLEGVDTAEDQILIACQKAGIMIERYDSLDALLKDITIERFEVVRYR